MTIGHQEGSAGAPSLPVGAQRHLPLCWAMIWSLPLPMFWIVQL